MIWKSIMLIRKINQRTFFGGNFAKHEFLLRNVISLIVKKHIKYAKKSMQLSATHELTFKMN